MKKKEINRISAMICALAVTMCLGCASAYTVKAENSTTAVQTETAAEEEYFTDRDKEQNPDLTGAEKISVTDGKDITVSKEGTYVLSGSAKNVTVTVDAGKDAKVQLVLDGLTVTNTDAPVIVVENADKVFVTTASGSKNTLSVSGTFPEEEDAVIYSRDDLTLNGLGTLTIVSSDKGIDSNDDLKITGGSYDITTDGTALKANDTIRIADGTIDIKSGNDGLHSENEEDDSLGHIYIFGGDLTIEADDDAVHAESLLVISGGTMNITDSEGLEATNIAIDNADISIQASDDGINAGKKSSAYEACITINSGTVRVAMNGYDTDAIDSNGNITVNGGTVDITGQSAFDCDGKAAYNGGTIIVNGQTVNAITSQQMGGGMRGGNAGNNGNFSNGSGMRTRGRF